LPGSGVAKVGSFAYLVGKPTRKRPEAATAHTGGRETPSKAVWLGMGYIIYILEMISNSSIGANPICPKSVDRAVVNHMGESERIAEKFVGIEYAGRAIEPRNRY